MKMWVVFTFVVAATMCVQQALSIKCYHCLDANDDCAKNGPGKIVECESDEAQGWRDALAKVVQQEGLPIPLINLTSVANACQKTITQGFILRSCTNDAVPIYLQQNDTCIVATANGTKIETCLCTGSLCNGSPSTIPGTYMVFTAIISIVMSKLLA